MLLIDRTNESHDSHHATYVNGRGPHWLSWRKEDKNNKAIGGLTVKDIDLFRFIYFGAAVSQKERTNEDIQRRLGHAKTTYRKLV